MSRGPDRLIKSAKQFADFQYKVFTARYGQQLIDLFEFPIKLVLSPFTLAFDIVGSAPRGFGVPELISKLSYASIFAVATLGTYDIALEMGKKVICQRLACCSFDWLLDAGIVRLAMGGRHCGVTCAKEQGRFTINRLQVWEWKAVTLTQYAVALSGEKATAECIADAIADNRAELVHLPSSVDLNVPLPSKDCPTCDGTGVMSCPECKNKLQVRISADDHIVDSMRDPSIAAFWLFSFPEIMGGFNYDGDVKQKIWWQYKESMRYDQLRDMVSKRKPGWEHLQEALISIDPVRARDDPVVVKNVPYYKAKKALEAEVMNLDPPPRPQNWGELDLPLNASSWSDEDLKKPEKFYEMTVLLNAQREIADKILDEQWENKWRQEKVGKTASTSMV
ncbi:unnamed protein product [Dovyalis caffra]|uniref:AtTam37 zinc finger domain-containing protein n=1 Tax=Dovyalis caffra TaxID=77055 RepID=A0AAV1R1B0_9ROSI|nr:unnamed protein product [Dovyalis caffra]